MKKVNRKELANKVGVLSCAHHAWLVSSRRMGDKMARAIDEMAYYDLYVPIDKNGFITSMESAAHIIIHMHGTPEALFDQREGGEIPKMLTIADIEAMPDFKEARLVFLTACSAAGGDPNRNVASALSKKIAKDGLVIANEYTVWGEDHDFGDKEGRRGWVGYRDGKRIITKEKIPAKITPADAYIIYKNAHRYV